MFIAKFWCEQPLLYRLPLLELLLLRHPHRVRDLISCFDEARDTRKLAAKFGFSRHPLLTGAYFLNSCAGTFVRDGAPMVDCRLRVELRIKI